MKNKKKSIAVLLLAAAAFLFTSCAFKLNTEQKKLYEEFISGIEKQSSMGEQSADHIKQLVEFANEKLFASKGFKIEDTKAGTKLEKGTKADDLRKRFVPKKA